jgi:hypothetical protein
MAMKITTRERAEHSSATQTKLALGPVHSALSGRAKSRMALMRTSDSHWNRVKNEPKTSD